MRKYFWRKYQCEDCFHLWERLSEHADPLEDCPVCARAAETAEVEMPKVFGGKSNASRAMEYTQQVLEQDYGVTNVKSDVRPGERFVDPPAAAKASPMIDSTARQNAFAQAAQATAGGSSYAALGLEAAKRRGSVKNDMIVVGSSKG